MYPLSFPRHFLKALELYLFPELYKSKYLPLGLEANFFPKHLIFDRIGCFPNDQWRLIKEISGSG